MKVPYLCILESVYLPIMFSSITTEVELQDFLDVICIVEMSSLTTFVLIN